MNYNLYKQARKKMLIKNIIFMSVIIGLALVSTYKIYDKFQDKRDKISKSSSLAVTFHDKAGEKVAITKITPVTDSVGLSSRAYRFTIKNNTATKVKYAIKIVPDNKLYKKEKCGEYKIPLNIIKVGIHTKGQVSDIYNLDDLNNNIIVNKVIGPQKEEEYTLRFWISKNTLTQEADMHFHGIIEVVEDGNDVAKAN